MSACAITPETYAAWRVIERDDELRPYDQERIEIAREERELDLLLADINKSPTVEKIEIFLKRGLELRLFTQRSIARSLERYHCQRICLADVEARPGAYPCFGTEEEVRRDAEAFRRKHVELIPVAAQAEEEQHRAVEHENLLAVVNGLIARRRACEQDYESESPE